MTGPAAAAGLLRFFVRVGKQQTPVSTDNPSHRQPTPLVGRSLRPARRSSFHDSVTVRCGAITVHTFYSALRRLP